MMAIGGPAIASIETVEIPPAITLRIYTPAQAAKGTVLFIHGGGFVIGSLDTHDGMCRRLAADSGRRVVAVDYRLAPEWPFPAAHEDCNAALAWIAGMDGVRWPISICGDSAGGLLAVATAHFAVRCGIAVAALGLLYPVVDPACDSASWRAFGEGHVLTREWMRWAWDAYLGKADRAHPDVAPLEGRLAELPPTCIITAACDPLRDEGEALGEAIVAAGGVATGYRAPGMIHGFASLPNLTPCAGKAVRHIAENLRQHGC